MRQLFRLVLIAAYCVAIALFWLVLFVGANQAFGQSSRPMPFTVPQFFDSNGDPLNGGLLYTCSAGSSCPGTPLTTWSDSTNTTMNANPVVMTTAGRPTSSGVFLGTQSYKLVLQTSAGAAVWTADNVPGTTVTMPNASYLYGLNSSQVAKKVIGINASNVIEIDADNLAAITLGTTPATAGSLRVPATWSLQARNAGNSANRNVIDYGVTTSDKITIGDTGEAITIVGSGVAFTASGTTTVGSNMAVGGCLSVGTTTGCASGFINVSLGIVKNGITYTNPGYTFEKYFTGDVKVYAGTELGATYPGLLSIDQLENFVQVHYELPRVGKTAELFDRMDVLLEKVEEQALYIIQLHKRIKALEEVPRLGLSPPAELYMPTDGQYILVK